MYRVRILGGWVYRTRRVLATLCLGVLASMIGYKVVFGANGMMVYRAKRTEYQQLQQQIEREQAENQLLLDQVNRLQHDPAAIESEARKQLHYVKPGEFVLVDPPKRDVSVATQAEATKPPQ